MIKRVCVGYLRYTASSNKLKFMNRCVVEGLKDCRVQFLVSIVLIVCDSIERLNPFKKSRGT